MATLEGFKGYAVTAGDMTDAELELCLGAAKEWFEKAGVPEQAASSLYDLGVYRLATYYADNRGPGEVGADTVPYGIGGIVLQLRNDIREQEE